ncbi:MAG: TatD family hydrolase [Candidatus Hermodarchaeota archaeon]
MLKKIIIPEPEEGLKFIDVHCHLPFPRPKNDQLPSDDEQYANFFKLGGVYLITSTIDLNTLELTLNFIKKQKRNFGFCCGWAPQTVTYTPQKKHDQNFKKWIEYLKNNPDKYLAIGEIGLDFHHAKSLEKRSRQIEILRQIFETTKSLDKPYVLHIRNAAKHEFDPQNPKHRYNKEDGANKEILNILEDYNINSKKVMWHCFSGPQEYGKTLSMRGFLLSIPSSSFGFDRWRKVIENAELKSLVTETDSYYQHPYKRGPVNIPSNARYSIAAIAYTHNIPQKKVSEITVQNAIEFFQLEIS